MDNENAPMDYDVQDEMFPHHHDNASTPQRSRMSRRVGPVWSDYETDTSDLDQESLDDDKETRANGGHPLLLSRTQLQRLESIMSTASRRSSGRERYEDIMDDFDEADEDLKDFALEYAKDIIAQSQAAIIAEDEGGVAGADNSQLLDQILEQQAEISDNTSKDTTNSSTEKKKQSDSVGEEMAFLPSDRYYAAFSTSMKSEESDDEKQEANDDQTATVDFGTVSNQESAEAPTVDEEINLQRSSPVLIGEPAIADLGRDDLSVEMATDRPLLEVNLDNSDEPKQNTKRESLPNDNPSLGDKAFTLPADNDQESNPFKSEMPSKDPFVVVGTSDSHMVAISTNFEDNFLSLAPDTSATTPATFQIEMNAPAASAEGEDNVLQSTITIDDETSDTDVGHDDGEGLGNSPHFQDVEQRLDTLIAAHAGDDEGPTQVDAGSYDGYISSESDVNDNIITDAEDLRSLDILGTDTTMDNLAANEKNVPEGVETEPTRSHEIGLLDFEEGGQKEALQESDGQRSPVELEGAAKEGVVDSSVADDSVGFAGGSSQLLDFTLPDDGKDIGMSKELDDPTMVANVGEDSLLDLTESAKESSYQEPNPVDTQRDLLGSLKEEIQDTVDEDATHSNPDEGRVEPSGQLTEMIVGETERENLSPSSAPGNLTIQFNQPSSDAGMAEISHAQVSLELKLGEMSSITEESETSGNDISQDRLGAMFSHSETSNVDDSPNIEEKFHDDLEDQTEKPTELFEVKPASSEQDEIQSFSVPEEASEDATKPSDVMETSYDSSRMDANESSQAGSLKGNDQEDMEAERLTFKAEMNMELVDEENSGFPFEEGDNTGLSLADELAQAMQDEEGSEVSDSGDATPAVDQEHKGFEEESTPSEKPTSMDDMFGENTASTHHTEVEMDDKHSNEREDDARQQETKSGELGSIHEEKTDMEINVAISPVVADLQSAGYVPLEANLLPDMQASAEKANLFEGEILPKDNDHEGKSDAINKEPDQPAIVEEAITFSSSVTVQSQRPTPWYVEEHLQPQKSEDRGNEQEDAADQTWTREELNKDENLEQPEAGNDEMNKNKASVTESLIVSSTAQRVLSSLRAEKNFSLNESHDSLPSFHSQEADDVQEHPSLKFDEFGQTDDGVERPSTDELGERKESIQIQLQSLNDETETKPKYNMESWNSQEELTVDVEAEQIQPESFRQTFSSLHRQQSFSSDEGHAEVSLQASGEEKTAVEQSERSKESGLSAGDSQEYGFDHKEENVQEANVSGEIDLAEGVEPDGQKVAEIDENEKFKTSVEFANVSLKEPEQNKSDFEEVSTSTAEQATSDEKVEIEDVPTSDVAQTKVDKDEEVGPGSREAKTAKVTLKLLDAEDLEVEKELKQRHQGNDNTTVLITDSNTTLTPEVNSSIIRGLTPDSTDVLADKLDELITPSIETRELDLSDSMINVMIDTPDVEEPEARQAADGSEFEVAPNQPQVSKVTFDLQQSLSPTPEHPNQTEAVVRDIQVDGQMMQLNMAVVDQYKDVFAHGGYTDRTQKQAIVVLSACEFPDKKTPHYAQIMDQLFIYVYHKVQEIDAQEYAIIYLQGGARKSQLPAMKWMKRCHDHLSRSIRKSIKSLFIVHPTFWTRTVIFWSRPFISSKFMRKLHLSPTLEHVNKVLPLGDVPIPGQVRAFDATTKR